MNRPGPGCSSLTAWRWIESHPGSVVLERTERGRFRVRVPDPSGNPQGVLFERGTLLEACYAAMRFEDSMTLLLGKDADELSVQTQRAEDRRAFQRAAEEHVSKAFDVQVKRS